MKKREVVYNSRGVKVITESQDGMSCDFARFIIEEDGKQVVLVIVLNEREAGRALDKNTFKKIYAGKKTV